LLFDNEKFAHRAEIFLQIASQGKSFNKPLHTWPSISTNVTGNGLTNSFMDITTDSNRVYRIGANKFVGC
jgi:hypothetical protein